MPLRDGLETIQALRSSQPALKIVAMSGGGRAGTLQFLAVAQHFGADTSLAKPFGALELLLNILD